MGPIAQRRGIFCSGLRSVHAGIAAANRRGVVAAGNCAISAGLAIRSSIIIRIICPITSISTATNGCAANATGNRSTPALPADTSTYKSIPPKAPLASAAYGGCPCRISKGSVAAIATVAPPCIQGRESAGTTTSATAKCQRTTCRSIGTTATATAAAIAP